MGDIVLLEILTKFIVDELWPIISNDLFRISKHVKPNSTWVIIFEATVECNIVATGYRLQ